MKNAIVSSVNRVKLLGVHIDGRLDFDYHVSQICNETSKKLHGLSKVSECTDINKRRVLMKAFITRSSLIVLWCGCLTAETLKKESIKYMKEL